MFSSHVIVFFPVLIVCALLVCWMPNQIRRLMTAAVPKSAWTASYLRSYVKLHLVADSFFYLSSVLNPLLYNLSSRQFRSAFLQTLLCRLSLQHANRRVLETSLASKSSRNTSRPLLRRSLDRIRAATADRYIHSSPAERPNPPNTIDRPLSSEPQEDEISQTTALPDPDWWTNHCTTLQTNVEPLQTTVDHSRALQTTLNHFRPLYNTSDHRRPLQTTVDHFRPL